MSPDGQRISFVDGGDGPDLCVMSINGWNLKRVIRSCKDCKDLRGESDGYLCFVRDGTISRVKPSRRIASLQTSPHSPMVSADGKVGGARRA